MALRYAYLIPLGLLILALAVIPLAAWRFFGRPRVRSHYTLRAANTWLIRKSPVYRRLVWVNRIAAAALVLSLAGAVLFLLVLLARPYETQVQRVGVKRRDIYLCLDISTSLCDQNYSLVDSLSDLVGNLEGDRIGICLFDSSPVLYVPLTDDYDFVLEMMEELKQAITNEKNWVNDYYMMEAYEADGITPPDYITERYEQERVGAHRLLSGAQYGFDVYGSSLVGLGLSSCLYSFPYLDQEERSRIVILSTDNSDQPTSPALSTSLETAAERCSRFDVTVFGIFPTEGKYIGADYEADKAEYEECIALTGGRVYEPSRTFPMDEIVEDIQNQKAMASGELTLVTRTDVPGRAFTNLLIFLSIALACTWVLLGSPRGSRHDD